MNKRNIAILGSTGSIGTQALDIISEFPDKFKVSVLTANKNWEMLVTQALKYSPDCVVIADETYYDKVKQSLQNTSIEVKAGPKGIVEVAALPQADMVLTAMVGYSGLLPTVAAIEAGKTIALANKETLVVAGEIITGLARKNGIKILPVDSEHSAIFQCLVGEEHSAMRKIILTASGGPFRTLSKEALAYVTVEDALKHPNWNMGAKVTIDSASMMNKGFEMIEARWLFDCSPENIEILVHPQSIVHSMVEFCDGSIKAQLGVPDMHIPIQYALNYPQRLNTDAYRLNWSKVTTLNFEKPDFTKFPLLRLAFEAIKEGGNMPCILNAANEIAVKAFLDHKIPFISMPILAEEMMRKVEFLPHPDLDDLITTNYTTREKAQNWVNTHSWQ